MKLLRLLLVVFCILDCTAYAEEQDYFPDVSTPMEDDLIVGAPKSAITIVEYSSLGCPHCAEYHKYILSQIREKYIDTNKIRYITRDFPSNNASVMGSMLARCHGEKRQKTLDILFESQHIWAFKSGFQEYLKDIMILGGMNEEQFNSCIHNTELREKLMKEAYNAVKSYNIAGTPAVFVNGHKVKNVMSITEIEGLIAR